MDAFNFDDVKLEKANAMRRYRRLRNITKLFRLFELCLVLVFISWISARLPFTVRISGDYFRHLISLLTSPTFIFLLSNLIVLTLLIKSGQFSAQSPPINNAETEIYEEFIKHSDNHFNFRFEIPPPESEPEETIVYQDKEIISEGKIGSEFETSECEISESKTLRRCKSENLKREISLSEKACEKLRRSETEKCRRSVSPGEIPEDCFVEKLSNEEFQRTIEAFIAKQVKFHQEEKMSIVLHNHS